MRSYAGINKKGDPLVCMVVGCGKKALYRTGCKSDVRRGYCSTHKELAVNGLPRYKENAYNKHENAVADGRRRPDNLYNWMRPLVDDGTQR